jgi:hypothetical protein
LFPYVLQNKTQQKLHILHWNINKHNFRILQWVSLVSLQS